MNSRPSRCARIIRFAGAESVIISRRSPARKVDAKNEPRKNTDETRTRSECLQSVFFRGCFWFLVSNLTFSMSLELQEAGTTEKPEQDYLWTLNFGPQHPATHT